MAWAPGESNKLIDARPFDPTFTTPSAVLPSRNVTEPLTTPAAAIPCMAEASTTCLPATPGFGEAVAVVVVGVRCTVWINVGELAGELFVSPRYLAMIAWDPAVRTDVENVARPVVPVRLEVPICIRPSKKSTLPAGASEPFELICATNVAEVP